MAILSESTLARIATWVERNVLAEQAEILRETRTPNPTGGGATLTWTVVATLDCAVVDAGYMPTERVIAAQQAGRINKIIFLPREADVHGNDRIRVSSITYHIVELYDPTTFEVMRRVLVRRSSLGER